MQGTSKEVVSLKNVFRFGGAYVAVVIGSGFATGQEIMQFFTAYGLRSIPAIFISMAGFAFIGAVLIRFGYTNRHNENIDPFKHFCGKYFGKFLEWFIPTFCFMVLVVMISGSGATINQYFGVPHIYGALFMAIVTLIVGFFSLNKIVDIVGTLGPLTIIFTLGISIAVLIKNPSSLANISDRISNIDVPMSTPSKNLWWFSGILYVAYNIVCSLPFLVEMGKTANSKKEAALGGVFGGVLLMLSGLMLNFALLSHIEDVYLLEIPNLYLTDLLTPILSFVFSLILIDEIFSTAVPMAWTSANKFGGADGTIKNKITILILCVSAFFLGQLPFGVLVGTIYPYTGYLGIAMLIMITAASFRD
jgi:uncharacterized membrane protein YkvI